MSGKCIPAHPERIAVEGFCMHSQTGAWEREEGPIDLPACYDSKTAE